MPQKNEWLVTDQLGNFAMGTTSGDRSRKYHGFFQQIASRGQWSSLADLEFSVDDRSLWPHRFRDHRTENPISFFKERPSPEWNWKLETGSLTFKVQPVPGKGIQLSWFWRPERTISSRSTTFRIRPFFACRDLHSLGGRHWELKRIHAWRFEVEKVSLQISENHLESHWKEVPLWYHQFFYLEEERRGYPATEDLFSQGHWEISLPQKNCSFEILLQSTQTRQDELKPLVSRSRVSDFLLLDPPGVVAGFPWFGEWGRDTFISLPGIVSSFLSENPHHQEIWDWAESLFILWGNWIESEGMIPNVLDASGKPQWESADATLWWTHSLAALWSISLSNPRHEASFREKFSPLLKKAIASIEAGRHRFLSQTSDSLLSCSGGATTWMDARIRGTPVTPRQGILPEINALWFQAHALAFFWKLKPSSPRELISLGKKILIECHEENRPNRVFLHSIPLAPSFVLNDSAILQDDAQRLRQEFFTPVGLRTLAPSEPGYCSSYFGNQEQRDLAYHQGTVWPWLGAHAEMLFSRCINQNSDEPVQLSELLQHQQTPILGHLPEIADAERPFFFRGAPAQAWSLATIEELLFRKRFRLDSQLKSVFSTYGL